MTNRALTRISVMKPRHLLSSLGFDVSVAAYGGSPAVVGSDGSGAVRLPGLDWIYIGRVAARK